ncbi:HeH/LEM domain-containing protein [Pseudomonas veronii]
MSDTSNYTTPENKARFGFKLDADGQVVSAGLKGGDNGAVVSGPTAVSDAQGGHNNGGGTNESDELRGQVTDLQAQLAKAQTDLAAERAKNTDPLDELTVVQIKEQLDAKGVTYKVNDSKAELLALLKGAQ